MDWLCPLLGLLAGLAVATLILSAGCRMVGVEPPDLFPGMMICMVVGIAQVVVWLMVGAVLAFGKGMTGLPTTKEIQDLATPALVIAFPVNVIVAAGLYSVMLQDCSFRRGLLVWLGQLVALIVFGAAIFGLFHVLTQKA